MHFFKHDTDAHKDEKIIALRVRFPDGAAVDCYYAIIERLYETEGPIAVGENQTETLGLCLLLNIGAGRFEEYVSAMVEIGILERDEEAETVYSGRVNAALAECARKHETAVRNGSKGGRPRSAKAKRNQAESKAKPSGKQKKPNKDIKTVSDNYSLSDTGDGRVADAADAAPRTIACASCGGSMQPTGSRTTSGRRIWRCDGCGEEEARDE